MAKSADAFRTISEVADWLGVQTHVLRFWESKFTQVKPVKRAGGRRYYRPADMLLLGGIHKLLRDDGMTIKGVQKILREQGMAHVSDMSQPLDDSTDEALDASLAPKLATPDPQPPVDEGPRVVPLKPIAKPEPEPEVAAEPEPAEEPAFASDPAPAEDASAEPELDLAPAPEAQPEAAPEQEQEQEPEPESEPVSEAAPEPVVEEVAAQDVAEEAPAAEPAPEAAAEEEAPAPTVPAFMRTQAPAPAPAAETSEPPAQDTAADEPPAEQEAPKPRVVHVEDEPDTLDDVSPSLLSHISRLRSVPAEHKSQVAALVKDLSAVRDRMAGARQARKD